MRDDLDPVIREAVPEELKAKVALRVSAALARNRARQAGAGESSPSGWSWLFRPALIGGTVAAGVAVFVLLQQRTSDDPAQAPMLALPSQYELEMLVNAELLDDLDVLENWEKLKKEPAGKWKKKRS